MVFSAKGVFFAEVKRQVLGGWGFMYRKNGVFKYGNFEALAAHLVGERAILRFFDPHFCDLGTFMCNIGPK